MSIQAVSWALKSVVGDPTLKVLLIAICNYANHAGQCWYSQATLAKDSEVSVRTIRRAISKLSDLGFIKTAERRRADGGNSTLLIQIMMDPPASLSGGVRQRPVLSDPPRTPAVRTPRTPGCPHPPDNMVAGPNEPSIEPSVEPSKKEPALRADDWPEDYEETFWRKYPAGRKTGKKAVMIKLARIRKKKEATWAQIDAGLDRFVASRPDPKYTKAPEVWLNKGCWDDEYNTGPQPKRGSGYGGKFHFSDLIMAGENDDERH